MRRMPITISTPIKHYRNEGVGLSFQFKRRSMSTEDAALHAAFGDAPVLRGAKTLTLTRLGY